MNTAGAVQLVRDHDGIEQDFTLHTIWRHVQTAALSVSITAYKVTTCNTCS